MKDKNSVWSFFASVKLALFTLSAISITAIIGTVIPQNQKFGLYAQQYGDTAAQVIKVLDLHDMYGSWWFLGLLGLLSANIIICSIDRFPTAWKQMTTDQSGIAIAKIEKMALSHRIPAREKLSPDEVKTVLKNEGWKLTTKTSDDGTVIAGQKGNWSRMGVYLVHTSMLVIFIGAMIGHFFGFKASVFLPETRVTDKVYAAGHRSPIDLGFELRCDFFTIDFYDNGMAKKYVSGLTVLEDGKAPFSTEIAVNTPLKHNGITFYQASYEGYKDFVFKLTDPADGTVHTFIAPFQEQVEWKDKDIVFGVVNAEAFRDHVTRIKIWFKEGNSEPVEFWVEDNGIQEVASVSGAPYSLQAKQMYATGLQVAKDPGVWLVYLGFFMMLAGLYFSFFTSHKRVWIVTGQGREVLVAGSANKNKEGFEKTFTTLTDKLTDKLA